MQNQPFNRQEKGSKTSAWNDNKISVCLLTRKVCEVGDLLSENSSKVIKTLDY